MCHSVLKKLIQIWQDEKNQHIIQRVCYIDPDIGYHVEALAFHLLHRLLFTKVCHCSSVGSDCRIRLAVCCRLAYKYLYDSEACINLKKLLLTSKQKITRMEFQILHALNWQIEYLQT